MKIKYSEPKGYFNSDMEKAFKDATKKKSPAKKTTKKSKKK